MRFTIVSDSLTWFTGFAKQTRLLAWELFRRGHEVIVVGRSDKEWSKAEWHNVDLACGPVEWPTDSFFDCQVIESMIEKSGADVVLFFRNAKYLQQFARSRVCSAIPTFFWYADENEAPEISDFSLTDGFPNGSVFAISQSVARTLRTEKIAGVLYCGVDFNRPPPTEDRQFLRDKWTKKLSLDLSHDDILLFCAERNDVRKNWDSVYSLFRLLKERISDKRILLLQLARHTRKEPFLDLQLGRRFYGIEDAVVDLAHYKDIFDDAEINELLRLCDLRISCAGSEGFGLLSLESAVLKVPQIAVKLNALAEYLGESNECLVEPYRLALHPRDEFYYSNKCYAIPDVYRMSERAVKMLSDADFRAECVEQAFLNARSRCHLPDLVDKFLDIVEKKGRAQST